MPSPTPPPSPTDWRETNRANWNERVPLHTAGDFYDLDGFRAGKDPLRHFELAEVGDVRGKSLLHLQCHIGTDTLSWARHGAARVVGLDFSEPAVEAARALASDLGFGPERAAFVASDVYDAASAVAALSESSYDIVYTGTGALCWLPDIRRWAETAAALVTPGGFLYLAEFHPLTDVLDDETGSRIVRDYFDLGAQIYDYPGTYAAQSTETIHNRTVEWQHPLGEVVSALAAAGLRIEFLHEHDVSLFRRFEVFEQRDGYFRLPADRPRIPLMYSLRAAKD
ncbi:class I SAM-dependent methyltransferase [Streptomyces coacervatus]|uniref:Class I SAM-dependent methyltransferase n=1 Tax=Streptomyces coacervatus TaxID=647381 RepID=A0ABP7HNQ2_9ACTN|nr:class I SAM-dependent methyltransferase [Streptomyces coacervatus]MDF2270745.1 class I SAM-dependent methyltransferase [Streptomyces coacervatus]